MTLLLYWLPFVLVALILTGVAMRARLLRAGRLVTQPLSEASRRRRAAVVFAGFVLVAALVGDTQLAVLNLAAGFAMATLAYNSAVRYRWQST